MNPRHSKRGLKLIPRYLYRFLSVWLAVLRDPYREDILWDIRWGFRREYNERRNLSRLYQHQATDYWFQREVISACGNTLWMRARNLATLIMMWIRIVG
jgi:hypothetical protein